MGNGSAGSSRGGGAEKKSTCTSKSPTQLDKATNLVAWPGLHVLSAKGKPPSSEIFKLNWFTAAGNQLFLCALLTAAALRVAPRRALDIFATTQLRWAILTVCSVLALAYVMNPSGRTITLGLWIAGTGAAFAFLSPIVGWFGTAVTGSDTSANSLFGALQVAAAHQSHLHRRCWPPPTAREA